MAGKTTRARSPRTPVLASALAEAAWAEADRALAQAMLDFADLAAAQSAARRKAALALAAQSMARAARRRGLAVLGAVGAVESYDPARHDLLTTPRNAPKEVRIVTPGVARAGRVLIKARVVSTRGRAPP